MIRLAALILPLCLASSAAAIALPDGFQDEAVAEGLAYPMAVRFAPDGRMFVAEKSGLVKVYDFVGDPTPTIFADLRTNVHNYWDRGLLGLALHPEFPAKPWVYVLYTHNALPGGTAPAWPASDPAGENDTCPSPPGPVVDGCVVTGRLSRLEIGAANEQVGPEHVLIENNWCQQFPSHSVGDLAFGPDGALYVSAGDGASFIQVDWGQYGGTLPNASSPVVPLNPCGDPPGGVGGVMPPSAAEGGALRAQDLRTPGDPVSFGGTILRIDPDTGNALPDNPLWGGAVPDDDRVVAYGLRNPFRIAVRPGTGELWIGDVGWNETEEINRLADPTALQPRNFGWPCYEGVDQQGAYGSVRFGICDALYAQPADTKPFFSYLHDEQPGGGDDCPGPSSSIAGLAFYTGGTYPASYGDTLFFADYSRACIWTLTAGGDGLPDPASAQTFASHVGISGPVALERGPGGDLFYVDFGGAAPQDGSIHRVRYTGSNHPPVAVATADPMSGASPLLVHFDGSASSDADPSDTLDFAWDLDADGAFDDAIGAAPTFTFASSGSYPVRLRVTDPHGASAVASLTVNVDNTPPLAVIAAPAPSLTWSVGDAIPFAGGADDPEQGALPASALRWQVVIQHCPGFDCHAHTVQDLPGIASGTFVAPDHEYPSFLEIRLTATDAGGLTHTTSVVLAPRVASLTFQSSPAALSLAVGPTVETTPFTRDVIVGSHTSIGAPSPQTLDGARWDFASWSDGGGAVHDVVAPAGVATLLATYGGGVCALDDDADGLCNPVDPCTGGAVLDRVRLGLSRLDEHAGNDRLRFSGELTLPISPSPVIDPVTRGLRLLLTDAAGTDVVDVTLPGGYDALARTGWKSRGTTSWRYNGGDDGPAHIASVSLRLSPVTGLVKFKVAGKHGTYPLDTTLVPLSATLVFDPPVAATGRCGTATIWSRGCSVNSSGTSVLCK